MLQLLLRAIHLDRDLGDLEHKKDMALLSALIEQGRFLFPNIDKGDSYGASKPPAYQGYRNLALEFLVAAYNLLHQQNSKNSRKQLILIQKHFTSIIFEVVNPKDRLKRIHALTDRFFIKEKSFEDFMENSDHDLLSHIWSRHKV